MTPADQSRLRQAVSATVKALEEHLKARAERVRAEQRLQAGCCRDDEE